MKKITATLLSLTLVAIIAGFKNPDSVYTVDAGASQLKWTGYHLAKSYEHNGSVKLKAGKISTNNGVITNGEFTIDMTSLTDTDVADAEKNAKLVGHLKSADFFDVANNPEAKLVITKSVASGNGILKTFGNLTIRGITKPIEFETNLSEGGNKIEAVADLKIARNDFNVMYGWKIENAMISGEFRMEVKLVAAK
jgi:polyisoprenoid-binding protein YceI